MAPNDNDENGSDWGGPRWTSYSPEMENPYPAKPGGKIADFEYRSPLVLYRAAKAVKSRGRKEDANYIVGRAYSVEFTLDGQKRVIEIPKGMLTDLASVP